MLAVNMKVTNLLRSKEEDCCGCLTSTQLKYVASIVYTWLLHNKMCVFLHVYRVTVTTG